MNEKDDMITHLGILSNLENGRKLARFSNSPGTGPRKGRSELMVLSEKTLYSVGRRWVYIFNRRKAKKKIPVEVSARREVVLAGKGLRVPQH